MYQRWLYQDYALRWLLESEATRQGYRTLGTRFHLTGLQIYLRYMLSNLPDIVAYWKLDTMLGATTPDSSRNNLPGTIIGASPGEGQISTGTYFDGLNDAIRLPYNSLLDLYTNFSLVLHFKPSAPTADRTLVGRGSMWAHGWHMYQSFVGNRIIFYIVTLAGLELVLSTNHVLGIFNTVVVTFTPTTLTMFINGVKEAPTIYAPTSIVPSTHDLYLGRRSDFTGVWWKENLDHFILYNRTLDDQEAYQHMRRRYPL